MLATDGQRVSGDCARLNDDELIATVKRLLRDEHEISARLLVHLGEVDARQLYRQHAYSSMFEYCVHALYLSEAEAYLRIGAARLSRRFPRALSMFAAGELHLSAIKLLAPVLDESNCEELLTAARYKSKREVEVLLAKRREQPDVPNVIRKLPQPVLVTERAEDPAQTSLLTMVASTPSTNAPARTAPSREREPAHSPPTAPSSRPASTLNPLGATRYKVQLTANQQLHDKLRQAQDLLRHELPAGDLAMVVERALDLLIADRMKRRFGQCTKPRKRAASRPKPDSRHIAHDVRRQVFARDGARCTFVSTDGKRCDQRGGLELHHEEPFGRGGPATVANIRVICRAHNQLLAEQEYGRAFIEQRIERAHNERGGRSRVPERTLIEPPTIQI